MKNTDRDLAQDNPLFTAPLAIVGIGSMFPDAEDTGTFWTNIKQGVDSIKDVPESHWRTDDYYNQDPKSADRVYAKMGGFLSPVSFNPMDYGILPNAIQAIDTSQLLGLLAVEQALKDSGYTDDKDFNRDNVSVILGVTGTLELVIPLGARLGHPRWREALEDAGVDDQLAEDIMQRISESYVPWQENSFPGLLGNVVAGRISKHFDLGGTNCVVDAACGSSLSALNLAALELAAGRSDMVITGGIDTFNDVFMYTCFSKTPALSPTGHARPYDDASDGTTLGEGLGIVVLKRLEDAERDGDKVYAVIKGIGASSDGKGSAIYEPDASGQAKALRRAYQQAGITPDTIELIEGHGTGTRVGDAVEVSALQNVFGRAQSPWCALGSIKSQIGHTKAAAGVAGLIKAALSLHHKILPATIKVDKPHASLVADDTAFYVNTETRPWVAHPEHPRRAGVSALGFGGSNFHCLLEEYRPEKVKVDWDGKVQILPFSAPDRTALVSALNAFKPGDSWQQLRRAAHKVREAYDAAADQRIVLVVEQGSSALQDLLTKAVNLLETNDQNCFAELPNGIYYGSGSNSGSLGMLFPGQGAQYPGMLQELALHFPEYLATLEAADESFSVVGQLPLKTLSSCIYPRPVFDEKSRLQQKAGLTATETAQPALGAVSLGAAQVLGYFGVSPQAAAGHSYGELVALCLSGALSVDDLYRLSRLRGELMAAGEGDRGSMAAVSAPLSDIESFLAEEQLDLVLANRNTPNQGVLSGTTAEIDRACQRLKDRGLSFKKLEVAAAFHSALVADAAEPFAKELEKISFTRPNMTLFSNTTGEKYPEEPSAIRALLSEQLANPVKFVAEIEAMYASGVRTFIEVGPGARLTGMVNTILEGHTDYQTIALDQSNGRRSTIVDLAKSLAKLSALGESVNFTLWDEYAHALDDEKSAKKGLSISLSGANHFNRPEKRPPIEIQPKGESMPLPEKTTEKPPASTLQPKVAPVTTDTDNLREALRITQQSLQSLQSLQEQTAKLHQQFLEGQQAATQSFMTLVQQQQQMIQGTSVNPISFGAPPQVKPLPLEQEQASTVNTTATVSAAPAKIQPEQRSVKPVQDVAGVLLDIVAEKTGYPVDMLELEMTLDGDLGIDSIKRVEILSALQEKMPELPAVKPEDLSVLQTLGQIVEHLSTSGQQRIPTISTEGSGTTSKRQNVSDTLLAVIAEKTGYPIDMLELDMALDSDLGIDSIKRVEILSALQEKMPELPAVKPEDLSVLQTLGQIVEHLSTSGQQRIETIPPTPQVGQLDKKIVSSALLAVIADKTGYPIDMLELDMALDSDLGIDSIKRVEILSALQEKLPGAPAVKPEHLGTLQTVAQIVDFLASTPRADDNVTAMAADRETPKGIQRQLLKAAPLALNRRTVNFKTEPGAEVWITDDGSALSDAICQQLTRHALIPRKISINAAEDQDIPANLSGLVLLSPLKGASDDFIRRSFQLVRRLGESLNGSAQHGGAFLTTVSRMNGCFGINVDAAEINDVLSGGLAGLTKTAALEWPSIHCKAIDLAMGMEIDATAKTIVDEIFRQSPVEVGITSRGLNALELETITLNSAAGQCPAREGDLVVISGGARGVTAEVAVALAKRSHATLLLLGRSVLPDSEPDWLAPLTAESDIKKALIDYAERPMKPIEVSREFERISAHRDIRKTMDRILNMGGTPVYEAVDLRDKTAVAKVIEEQRSKYGPVKGVIHGAGVLADKLISDKTDQQFDSVYSTKIDGLRAVLAATEHDNLGFIALFSSSTARFGRIGQVDYAMANEVLNKMAQQKAQEKPDCRVVSVNWGPWNGGMVTASLKKVFAQEGIEVIDLESGAEYLVDEISSNESSVEIVIMGGDATENIQPAEETHQNLYVSKAFDLDLSVELYPFLKSHVMDGKAVLPMAVIIEWMTHGAMHNHPGLKFQGFNDLRVLKGVILEQSESRELQVLTGKAIKSDGVHVVPVELSSRDAAGQVQVHARCRIVLSTRLPEEKPPTIVPVFNNYPLEDQELYHSERLFHGKDFYGIRQMIGCSPDSVTALANPAPRPEVWISQPLRNSWFADPLAIDSSFQLMILWSFEQYQSGSLPVFAERYRQFQERFPTTGVEVRIHVISRDAHKAIADIEFINPADNRVIARMENYECVIDASLNASFKRNCLTGVA